MSMPSRAGVEMPVVSDVFKAYPFCSAKSIVRYIVGEVHDE